MKMYLFALGAGLLAGVMYSLIGVRSPAPPVVGLVGLLGILLGEQIVPVVKHAIEGRSIAHYVRTGGKNHVMGTLPTAATPPQESQA